MASGPKYLLLMQAEQSTDGIEECLSQRWSAEKVCGKECGMHYMSTGAN